LTITAKVIAHSITLEGQEILTFEWVYPRIVLAEVNTHRVFSRNSASSRAIPVNKMNDAIRADIARPVRFGAANPGMQDNGAHNALINGYTPEEWWDLAIYSAIQFSTGFNEAGYAKQVCNRLTEAGSHMKSVVTSTDFDNWDWLRDHDAADPTIALLARVAVEAREASTPVLLEPGMWHTPYYGKGYWKTDGKYGKGVYKDGVYSFELLDCKHGHTLEEALAISSSCCAQVSFRTTDDTLEKALKVKERLVQENAVHGSPFEHQATPIHATIDWDSDHPWKNAVNDLRDSKTWEEGITHVDREGQFHSGNLSGWIQHRQLIPGHDYASSQKKK
jgi:hypothetical protein